MADAVVPEDEHRETGRLGERFGANFFQCGEQTFNAASEPHRRCVFVHKDNGTEVEWLNAGGESKKPFDIQIR